MIAVTYTHRNGVEELTPVTIAIDPEKIVSTRDRGAIVEIEYGETFDRRRQPIVYKLNTDRASIDALIYGNYADGIPAPYLSLTVIWALDRAMRPPLGVASYPLDLQEKYIVDIRDVTDVDVNGTKTDCRRIEYVPGSFVPVVIYVSDSFNSLITATPTTTTTTTEEVTTTTTTEEEVTTTTTTAAATTTTTTAAATTTTTTAEVTTTTTTAAQTTTTTTTAAVTTTTTTVQG